LRVDIRFEVQNLVEKGEYSSMKWLILPLLVLFALPVLAQTPTIAVIDPQRVVQNSQMGKKALAEIKTLKDKKQQEIDQRQASIQAMRDKLDKQKDILSADAKEKLQADIQKSITDLRRLSEDSEQEIQGRLQTAIKGIEDRVLPIIQKIGEDRGYSVIIQKDQLVYFSAKNDITDEVIKLFDDAVAKGQTAPPKPQ
jgi:outer membrane protein